MVFRKCALGGRTVNKFDGNKHRDWVGSLNARPGFTVLACGAKLKPLEPEKYEQHGTRGFMHRIGVFK